MNALNRNKFPNKIMQKGEYSVLAGWLIDGTGSPYQEHVIIDVSDNRIREVRRAGEGQYSDSIPVIDYSDSTVIPGLLDCHVHLSLSGNIDPDIREKEHKADFEIRRIMIEKNIRTHLSNGVIAVRDGGDKESHTLKYKREVLSRNKVMPLIIHSPGSAWHSHGRYGAFIGRSPVMATGLKKSIIDFLEYTDHVKIINSGINSLQFYGRETCPQFENKQLIEAINELNKRGIKSMIHANGVEAVRSSIDAGCSSIEHGFFMGRENMRRMAEKGIVWVPTVFTMKALSKIFKHDTAEVGIALKYMNHQLDQINEAVGLGVNVAIGTDSGSPGVFHGTSIFEEMKLFHLAGISIEKTIQCATKNGAHLLGLDREYGQILPGFTANLSVINKKPEEILSYTTNIPEVSILNGSVFHKTPIQ